MDGPAIKAGLDYFRNKTPERLGLLSDRAKQGLPPEAPTPGPDAEPWEYSYSWVELGKDERRTLGLSNAFESKGEGNWKKVADAREKGEAVVLVNDRGQQHGRIEARQHDDAGLEPQMRKRPLIPG